MDISGFELLSKYKIAHPKYGIAKSKEEAAGIAKKIGFPVAIKILSPHVLHKTDRGGVILGLACQKDVEDAYEKLLSSFSDVRVDGVLVQKMAKAGAVELIVGGKRDEQFGQLIMLGMGGIFVEVYKDVTFRVCPISREEALEMIGEIKAKGILEGARGRKPIDKKALASTLVAVSKILEKENPAEFEINPLMAYEKGCLAVDVRIIR
jgi:acetyl-CoA synthetase (ADP-forming)